MSKKRQSRRAVPGLSPSMDDATRRRIGQAEFLDSGRGRKSQRRVREAQRRRGVGDYYTPFSTS